jgi:uncharacterized metal-binding protein YceD (DUF177 family)
MGSENSKIELEINGLKQKRYVFEYSIGPAFFDRFQEKSYKGKEGIVHLEVNKSERLITIDLKATVSVVLECDRSLEPFDYKLDFTRTIFIREGEPIELEEIDVDLYQLDFGIEKIDLSDTVHELIELELPSKRIHPDYEGEDFEYSTGETESDETENDSEPGDLQKELEKLKNRFK